MSTKTQRAAKSISTEDFLKILPLYIGQSTKRIFQGMPIVSTLRIDNISGYEIADWRSIKLLLRPLSDITDQEAIDIAILGDDLIQFSYKDFNTIRDSYMVQVCWEDQESGPRRFMIQLEGRFLTSQNPVNNYQYIFKYLLEHGFDIFDLIPAGYAETKTSNKK
jgi:hypothetical protein